LPVIFIKICVMVLLWEMLLNSKFWQWFWPRKHSFVDCKKIEATYFPLADFWGRFHQHVYTKLLLMHEDPKLVKIQSSHQCFLSLWDLRAKKLRVKCWWNRPFVARKHRHTLIDRLAYPWKFNIVNDLGSI